MRAEFERVRAETKRLVAEIKRIRGARAENKRVRAEKKEDSLAFAYAAHSFYLCMPGSSVSVY